MPSIYYGVEYYICMYLSYISVFFPFTFYLFDCANAVLAFFSCYHRIKELT
jgi:hypothetical protein